MLGIAKSLIPEPQGHGLAVLECAGVCFVIWMLTYTQRQKEMIETDLRRSEERLRALVQHASDVIMVLQADGEVSYTSPALLRLLGYDAARAHRRSRSFPTTRSSGRTSSSPT